MHSLLCSVLSARKRFAVKLSVESLSKSDRLLKTAAATHVPQALGVSLVCLPARRLRSSSALTPTSNHPPGPPGSPEGTRCPHTVCRPHSPRRTLLLASSCSLPVFPQCSCCPQGSLETTPTAPQAPAARGLRATPKLSAGNGRGLLCPFRGRGNPPNPAVSPAPRPARLGPRLPEASIPTQ